MQAALLAAGELPDRAREVCVRKTEALEQLRRRQFPPTGDIGRALRLEKVTDQFAANGIQLVRFLAQPRHLCGLPSLDNTGGWLQGPRDQVEQRGFAGGVGAEDAGSLARSDPPFDVL